MTEYHIPYLSEDEKLFLNTTATYSQARRTSSIEQSRASFEENPRMHRYTSGHSLSSFFWRRRGSSTSSFSSVDYSMETECISSPKAKELETLIFYQPQRTVRLSLTPRCAV
jgi:hypothetical protein